MHFDPAITLQVTLGKLTVLLNIKDGYSDVLLLLLRGRV